MSRARWMLAGVVVGAVVVLVVGAGLYRRAVAEAGRWEAERDAALVRADSVQQAAARTRDALLDAQTQAQASAQRERQAVARATRAERRADGLAASRDSIREAGPVAGDSVGWLRDQLAAVDAENDALRAANAEKDRALAEADARAAMLYAAVDSGVAALRALDAVNRDLSQRLQEATAPCGFLWFSCPSRTTTAIVGAAVGGGVVAAIKH